LAAKYYTITDSPVSEHDVDVSTPFYEAKNEMDEDWLFVEALKKRVFLSKGSRTAIEPFLAYQLKGTSSAPGDFLQHTRSLVLANARGLQPYGRAAGAVLEWIDKQDVKPRPSSRPESKPDPEFDEIVKDREKMSQVLARLRQRQIVDVDDTWRGISEKARKTELVAFVNLLLDHDVLKMGSKTKLGRIFSKKFNCRMNVRNFSD
jgi:hypothetical protein